MKTRQLILKIATAVLSALTIVPLFINFIALRNGEQRFRYEFGALAGSNDALLIISRILFIATIVVAMILLVTVILQFIFKNNEILNWIVVGASVFIIITASLMFVSTLLYCLSISKIGSYVWYPAIGPYIMLAIGLVTPIVAMLSNKNK